MPGSGSLRAVVLAGLAFVVVAEGVARLQGARLCTDRPGVVYERDPDLGWRHARNLSGRAGTCDSDAIPTVPIETDADGVLGPVRPRAKPPDAVRVLLLGGNAVEGFGVPDDMTVGRLLEAYVDERRGPRLEVVNAATGGWAIDNALAFYRRDGRARSPDVVLLALDPMNDVVAVSPPYLAALGRRVPAKPYFALEEGRAVPRPLVARQPSAASEAAYDSPPMPELVRLLRGIPHHVGAPMAWTNEAPAHGRVEDERGRALELVRGILEAFRDDVAAAGGRLVAVIMPLPQAFAEQATGLAERQGLTAVVDDLDVPMLDLTPVLSGIETRLSLFASNSVRLGGEGHARAASAIWRFMVDRRLLPSAIVPATVPGGGRRLPALADAPRMAATAMWDARHGLVGRFAQAGLLAVCLGWIASVLPLPWRDWVAVGLGIAVLCLLAGEPVALAGVALALTAYGAIEVLPRLRGGPVLALALGILVLGTSRLQAYHVPGTPWDVPAVIAAASGVALLRVVAYASDRSRGAPRLRLHEFLAAFFFFPTLPAGPIESPHAFVARRASSGGTPPPLAALAALARLVVGCAEFTLAPLLLLLLDTDVFASRGAAFGRLRLWLFVAEAGLLPTLLLDGWSNVAIALARLAGHDVPANVRAPWAAVDVADFWRRWHASFSRWLRDYVYGPLGGRRAAVRNVVLAFAVAAAWYVWGFVKLLGYQAYAPRAWRGLLVCAGANAAVVAVLYAFRLDRAPRAVAAAVRPVRSVATLAFVCLAFLPLVMPLSATFRDLAGVYLRLFGVR